MKWFNKIFQKLIPGDSKAVSGTVWNIISMGVVGVAGLVMTVAIAKLGGKRIVGVYNELLAIYTILGQLASAGSQQSVIYFWNNTDSEEEHGKVCISLLIGTLINSLLCLVGLYIYQYILGALGKADELYIYGIGCMAPAILLFGVNKYLLGILNANRDMKKYAGLQMLRYFALIVYVVAIFYIDDSKLYYSFLVAELLVLAMASLSVSRYWKNSVSSFGEMVKKWKFGYKAMLSGVIGDMNTKVDILVLGIFMTSAVVGVYSFAALVAEGFYAIIVVFRSNLNPVFARLLSSGQNDELQKLHKEVNRKLPIVCLIGAGCILLGYGIGCCIIGLQDYLEAIVPMGIILVAQCIASPEIVKGNLLTVSGKPGIDTKITMIALGSNICLNFIMIPLLGIIGAAVATAIANIIYKIVVCRMHNSYHIYEDAD